MRKEKKGIDYYLSKEKIREYQAKSVEFRLRWLYQANVLRKYLPKKVVVSQDKFRQAKI